MKNSSIFSEKLHSFLQKKKKREENKVIEKEKKEKFFDVNNFKVHKTDELAKNAVQIILREGKKGLHNTEHVVEGIIAHGEGRDYKEKYESGVNCGDGHSTHGISLTPNWGGKNVKGEGGKDGKKKSKEIRGHGERTGRSENFSGKNTGNQSDDPLIAKMNKLRLKINNRYLGKCQDEYHILLKEYHNDVSSHIDEIKKDTFTKASLLRKDIESTLHMIETYAKEAIHLKWETNEMEISPQKCVKDSYECATRYYKGLMTKCLSDSFALNDPTSLYVKTDTENLGNYLLREVKKEIITRQGHIEKKWKSIQELFSKVKEHMKIFILNFEEKHQECVKDIHKRTEMLFNKLREKIICTSTEVNNIISRENENNRLFFSQFLTHFNDYVVNIYKDMYRRYSKWETLFFNITNEHDYTDNCYVYYNISKNYMHNLPCEYVFNEIMVMFEFNYCDAYKRRNELMVEDFFYNFFHLENYKDFYIHLNKHYEDYLKRYEELKEMLLSYKHIVLHIFFNLNTFLSIIGCKEVESKGMETKKKAEKKTERKTSRKEGEKASEVLKDKTKCDSIVSRPNRKGKNEIEKIRKMALGDTKVEENVNPHEMICTTMIDNVAAVSDETEEKGRDEHRETCGAQVSRELQKRHDARVSRALLESNKVTFEHCVENVLCYYNVVNLRDDFFLLTFLQFIEFLKSEIILMYSQIEKKIKRRVKQCLEDNHTLKEAFNSALNEYNANVQQCMQCKDYIELNRLLLRNDEVRQQLEEVTKRYEEKANTLNGKYIAELRSEASAFFFSVLRKARIVAGECEEIGDVEGETDLGGDTGGESEQAVVQRLLGEKCSYRYDLSDIMRNICDSYECNMRRVLQGGIKGKTVKGAMKGAQTTKGAKARESRSTHRRDPIGENIALIRREMTSQRRKEKRVEGDLPIGKSMKSEHISGKDSTAPDQRSNTGKAGESYPPWVKNSCDQALFDREYLQKNFHNFVEKFYDYFRRTLLGYLLNIKIQFEKHEFTKYFETKETNWCRDLIEESEKKLQEKKERLKERFTKNKKIFHMTTKKLNELIEEYSTIMKDNDLDKNVLNCIKRIEKLFSKQGENMEKGDKDDRIERVNEKYNNLFTSFKDNYLLVFEKLQCMEENLRKEIKKVEQYNEMIVRVRQRNVDIDEITKCLQFAKNFLQYVVTKKREDINNIYNANVYIFNNKMKIALSKRNSNIEIKEKKTSEREMITYLSIKEEIKNNILLFYLLIYYIKNSIFRFKEDKLIGFTKGVNTTNISESIMKKYHSPRFTKSSFDHRIEKKGKPSKPHIHKHQESEVDFQGYHSKTINPNSKYAEIEHCIYEINTFEKVKKMYELEIARKKPLLRNFLLSTKISQNINRLLFLKGGEVHEMEDDSFPLHLRDDTGGKGRIKADKDNPATPGCSNSGPEGDCPSDDNGRFNRESDRRMGTNSNAKNGKEGHIPYFNEMDSEEDKKKCIQSFIVNANYCDVKFFLYICVYIVRTICEIVLTPRGDKGNTGQGGISRRNVRANGETSGKKGSEKDDKKDGEKGNEEEHYLFICYDRSHFIYKNSILRENTKGGIIQGKNLTLGKKPMSSRIYLPNHLLCTLELTNLYSFERELLAEIFRTHFATMKRLSFIDEKNNGNFVKLQGEYSEDAWKLAFYLKVLSRKTAYFTFGCVYEHHLAVCRERIVHMQGNFKKKFTEVSKQLKIISDNPDIVARRKKELKSLFNLYVLGIKKFLTNHMFSLYENLCNNLIFFVSLLSLLPEGFFPHNSVKNGNPCDEDNVTKRWETRFLKIEYRDSSAEYDLSDLSKKIEGAYGESSKGDDTKRDRTKESSNTKEDTVTHANKEVLYMAYSEDNSFIVNKLEKKIEKYMAKFYKYVGEKMDEKKKEAIKMISKDKKEHRTYYE
ncbi:conserved Plasmodium protein, unknown function [Plasmodium ovale]|uniref:Uncharacterized protein n=2 Tax=Plasmodium ovale TaxID=36330 RepID=A0A1A8VS49_PLAOA|nr:conserved Plasmodium protein, unknown function [Plasmodium ovale curtisi]SCA48723.1 conserved Plasmodium protein, unknown function [Plasmodium ovale]